MVDLRRDFKSWEPTPQRRIIELVKREMSLADIAEILGTTTMYASAQLSDLADRGVLVRVSPGKYSLGTDSVKTKPLPEVAPSRSFISPIPKSRLMGGKA